MLEREAFCFFLGSSHPMGKTGSKAQKKAAASGGALQRPTDASGFGGESADSSGGSGAPNRKTGAKMVHKPVLF